MKFINILFCCFLPFVMSGQTYKGIVINDDGEALVNATIQSIEVTSKGVTTDINGAFEINMDGITDQRLIFSYVGYHSDTLLINTPYSVMVTLTSSELMEVIEVTGNKQGTFVSSYNPIKTEVITQEELTKSACCDLAGCFNTQTSVQPNTTNIVTNAKELRILGLSGVYNQVLIDGMPLIQGLTYTYGISTVPGTLVKNIFISKGANSVLQGFDGMSGQINVILKDPSDMEKLLVNVYGNNFLESQYNVNYSHRFKKWSTLFSVHSHQPAKERDRDKDDFLDLPKVTRYSFYNKWKYGDAKEKGWYTHFALRYINEERIGGQTDFDRAKDEGTTNRYGQTVEFSQPEFYTKTSYRLNDQNNIVFFGSASQQSQTSYFGTSLYDADQVSWYANLQYELKWHDKHDFKTGLSLRNLDLEENISFTSDTLNRTYDGFYNKDEQIVGLFAENTFNWNNDKVILITGMRLDHHNQFGWFFTPRALLKYNLTENTTARISAGTGWRTLNLFSENVNLLASSRDIIIAGDLKPEKTLNYGANLTHKIYGENVESQLTFDFYRTEFSNQIFPDYDADPTKAFINNFTGTSVSNGFQAEAGFDFIEIIGIKFAYNYLDVYRIVEGEKFVLPFNATHRLTGTFSYKPRSKKWHFDMNAHWYGKQRLANTSNNPPEFQLPESSNPYMVINAQFTKSWKKIDWYMGVDNIFDLRQKQPILSWQNPFGTYFDTSSVWGPTKGRELYMGIRYVIE